MPTVTLTDSSVIANRVYLTDGDVTTTTITTTAANNLASNTGSRYVKIEGIKVETDLVNAPLVLPIAQGSGQWDNTDIMTQLTDLRAMTETLTVEGYFSNESDDTALNKKKNLAILAGRGNMTDNDTSINRGGNITFVWGAGDNQIKREGMITKFKIIESPGEIGKPEGSSTDPKKAFNVAITFIVGEEVA